MDEWPPTLRKRYHHVRVLGQGAFGEVAVAVERATGRRVAVKRVFLRAGAEHAALREARALQAAAHPNVVALVEALSEGSQLYLVQELCSTDLSRLIAACYDPLPPQITKGLLRQLLLALDACHAAGVMHRDVKPSNLLISFEGLLKLADFGLARGMGPEGAAAQQDSVGCTSTAALAAAAAAAAGPGSVAASSGGGGGSESSGSGGGNPRPRAAVYEDAAAVAGRYSAAVATRWYRAPELLYGAQQYDGAAVDMWGAGMVFAELLGLAPLIPGSSDIGQLALMQQLLGSFSTLEWPELAQLPDWGKVLFEESSGVGLAALLPDAPEDGLDLLGHMLRYPPHGRPFAAAALAHPYFSNAPPPAGPREILQFSDAALSRHDHITQRLAALGS
ncbi:cyclin-dependent kinase 20 [Monoraphidium neglectum]|uniref:cyclin-dependent kinase n=1 Tax=Monoraphidium neglectum TaxID=145388 RepID=A0A0D2J910_9CHLO|nr:cyclin-dependent kinase 20 [Monoraphidium neglectum]KIY96217.1 cyclin-dependent kinase 20 [Monoraphidium neglectum]|eukprot:XP_013895237.1 cyclin-dependent kinase 20 [Monoraphidium neglectum]